VTGVAGQISPATMMSKSSSRRSITRSPRKLSSSSSRSPRSAGQEARAAITLILYTLGIGYSRSPVGRVKSIKLRTTVTYSDIRREYALLLFGRRPGRAISAGHCADCRVTTTMTTTRLQPWVRYFAVWVRNIMYRSRRRRW